MKCEFMRLVVDKLSKKTNYFTNFITIVDLTGLTMAHLNRAAYTEFAKVNQVLDSMYKEILGPVFVINAPRVFQALWNAAKEIMSERTVSKVQVLGPDYITHLNRFLDVSILPQILGGNRSPSDFELESPACNLSVHAIVDLAPSEIDWERLLREDSILQASTPIHSLEVEHNNQERCRPPTKSASPIGTSPLVAAMNMNSSTSQQYQLISTSNQIDDANVHQTPSAALYSAKTAASSPFAHSPLSLAMSPAIDGSTSSPLAKPLHQTHQITNTRHIRYTRAQSSTFSHDFRYELHGFTPPRTLGRTGAVHTRSLSVQINEPASAAGQSSFVLPPRRRHWRQRRA
jgi:hypothetical protein